MALRVHFILGVLTVALAVVACGDGKKSKTEGSDDQRVIPQPGDPLFQDSPLSLQPSVQSFDSCGDLENYIEERLIQESNQRLDQQLEWAKEWADRRAKGAVEEQADNSASEPAAGSMENDSAGGPDDFTTTNNQVAGVEEADFVKNTGTHIFHLATGRLHILKSWPATEMVELSSMKIPGRATQMLLNGDNQLIVIGYPNRDEVEPGFVPGDDYWERYWGNYAYEFTKVTVVDVTDKANPVLSGIYILKGYYQASRRIDQTVRLVLNDYRYHPEGTQLYVDAWENGKYLPLEVIAGRIAAAKIKNAELIRSKDLAYWLEDRYYSKWMEGVKTPLQDLTECSRFYAPTVSTQFGFTRIANIDLTNGNLQQTVLLSYSSQIYSSRDGMYLVTPYYWWSNRSMDRDYSFIHGFDVSTPGDARYIGSGGVEGSILNQFSMDEHQGYLRVASAITKREPDQNNDIWWGNWSTANRVTVLQAQEGQLVEVGRTPDLAAGERIFSARFAAERGFVVTFRQVDPLFAIDLSDPTAPTVLGELKIPGFSTYMQFIDENHLLTIGQDATETGRALGMKLSLFDVSDMTAPREAHSHVLDGQFWSEAQWDHKAFTYFAARKQLAIPASGYSSVSGGYWWERYKSVLKVFSVDVEAGIAPIGEVGMTDIYTDIERPWGWWSVRARVSRSIFADDYVYAISQLGVRVTRSDSLSEPVATVSYPCNEDCYGYGWW